MKTNTFAQLQSICAVKYVYNTKNRFVYVNSNVLSAMRFGWLKFAEREIIHVLWDMSRSDVSTVTPQKPRSDKGSLRYEEHVVHACELRLCPVSCELCKRLCSGDHLHGLNADQNHLCGCASHYLLPATLFIFIFLAKNTPVARYVQRRVYATSTQLLNPLRQRLLAGMKPSNTPR
jgi:hypothetical protein